MSTADSVTIFAEGTYEEQVRDLVDYLGRGRTDEQRTALVKRVQDALADGSDSQSTRQKLCSIIVAELTSLGSGSEKEIEGFLNLFLAHLLSSYESDSPELREHIQSLLKVVSSSPTESVSVKFRILSNIFNTLPRDSALRLPVYQTLISTAVAADDLDTLQITVPRVERWLSEWHLSPEQTSAFLKQIAEGFATSGQSEQAYQFQLLSLRTLPSSYASQETVGQAIASAVSLPTVFDFDPLFHLDAILNAKNHELMPPLQIFVNGNIDDLKKWSSSNSSLLSKYNLNEAVLERKLRLLTLSGVAFQNVGHDLSYSKIAEALQIPPSEVERWAIDVIRAGLVSGKLSQATQTFQVTRSTSRIFEKEHWELLEERLVAWKKGLEGVLDVIVSAKRGGEANSKSQVAVDGAVPVQAAAA